MSSSTTTRRASRSSSATGGQRRAVHRGQRAAVHDEAGDLLQHLGLGRGTRARRTARAAASSSSSHFCCSSTDRGRCPAASARAITFADSAMYSPPAGSLTRRSATSVSRDVVARAARRRGRRRARCASRVRLLSAPKHIGKLRGLPSVKQRGGAMTVANPVRPLDAGLAALARPGRGAARRPPHRRAHRRRHQHRLGHPRLPRRGRSGAHPHDLPDRSSTTSAPASATGPAATSAGGTSPAREPNAGHRALADLELARRRQRRHHAERRRPAPARRLATRRRHARLDGSRALPALRPDLRPRRHRRPHGGREPLARRAGRRAARIPTATSTWTRWTR